MKRARGRRRNQSTLAGLIVVTIALLLSAVLSAQAQEWQTFKYPEDGFSAAFPSAPQQESRQIDTPSGAVELRSYTLELDQVALFVGVCDYGTKAEGNEVEAMLEGAKKGALENSKAQLTRESKISLGSYHGVEFESEAEGTHSIARMYMVGTMMYQILVVYPSTSPYEGAAHFLDSFQLIARTRSQ